MFEIVRFGSITLPPADPVVPLNTGQANSPVVNLIGGGGYRVLQNKRAARDGPLDIPYKCAYVADTEWEYAADLVALRGMFGLRDKLYRRRLDVDYTDWAWAELVNNDGSVTPQTGQQLAIDCLFRVYDATWRGSLHGSGIIVGTPAALPGTGLLVGGTAATTFLLDTAHLTPNLITLPCGGNAPVRATVITITPAGSAITSITVEGMTAGVPKWKWTWTGPGSGAGALTIGRQLVVSTGSKRIRLLDTGVYTDAPVLPFLDYATVQTTDWFLLDPRFTNTIKVTKTGGSASSVISFLYHEANI